MKIAIMQPTYLPWLGYFELMANCDFFVFLDDTQFVKKSWHNRNRIKTANGELMLTVPVLSKGKQEQKICEALIDNTSSWKRKHVMAIESNYRKADFFNIYIEELRKLYMTEHKYLADFTTSIINVLQKRLGIATPTMRSSSLNIGGMRSEKIINICHALHADTLYDAQGAREVLDMPLFDQHNIKVIFQEYKHPIYRQLYGEFIFYLSALDLLFNEGSKALNIICSSGDGKHSLEHTDSARLEP